MFESYITPRASFPDDILRHERTQVFKFDEEFAFNSNGVVTKPTYIGKMKRCEGSLNS